jgi:uncharacterized protein (TIGR01244 family)
MTLPRAFFLAMAAGIVGVPLLSAGPELWGRLAGNPGAAAPAPDAKRTMLPDKAPPPPAKLGEGISVRNQITLASIPKIKEQGYRTLIDLRPDGEAPDQPTAAAVSAAAGAAGLKFAYVPTPHGDIPAATVDAFAQAIAAAEKPVLLYCRSGNRAARVWALAEASRPGGADAATIADTVRSAGQKVDDLTAQIATRIAQRPLASANAR